MLDEELRTACRHGRLFDYVVGSVFAGSAVQGGERVVFWTSEDAAAFEIGALVETLGFASIKLGGFSEGGLLVQAHGNSGGDRLQVIGFERGGSKVQPPAYGSRAAYHAELANCWIASPGRSIRCLRAISYFLRHGVVTAQWEMDSLNEAFPKSAFQLNPVSSCLRDTFPMPIPLSTSRPLSSKGRILCIEDDEAIAAEIADELRQVGFEVEHARDGAAGYRLAISGAYDAITLDRMLPGMDGLDIVTGLRAAGIATPVLMISALSEIDDRIRGLRAGGDDYLTKPFASEEMAARIEVLLRRADPDRATVLSVRDFELDLLRREGRRGGEVIPLQPVEFKLIEFLLRHQGTLVTRAIIFQEVFGYRFDPGSNLIDVHLGRLRRKIERPGLPNLIRTLRGEGFILGGE